MYRGETKAESVETKNQDVYFFNLLFSGTPTPYNSASERKVNFFFFSSFQSRNILMPCSKGEAKE